MNGNQRGKCISAASVNVVAVRETSNEEVDRDIWGERGGVKLLRVERSEQNKYAICCFRFFD